MTKDENSFSTEEWIHAIPDEYNLDEAFLEEVVPLLEQLEAKCRELNIPYYLRFVTIQDMTGNSTRAAYSLGGPVRATPELLAIARLEQLGAEFIEGTAVMLQATFAKYARLRELRGETTVAIDES